MLLTVFLTIFPFLLEYIKFLNIVDTFFYNIKQILKFFSPSSDYFYIDDVFHYLTKTYIKAISTSIPIISALYYFVYREQKNISLRDQHFVYLLLYFSISVSSIILSIILKVIKQDSSGQVFFMEHEHKIIYSLILYSLAIIFLFLVIFSSLRGINLQYQLKKSRKNLSSKMEMAYYVKNPTIAKNIYPSIHNNFESIFQILDYTRTNKMDKLFKDELDEFSVLLQGIWEQSPGNLSNIYPKELMSKNEDDFRLLYSALVKNIGNLFLNVHNDNKLTEVETTLEILKSLEPNKVPELYPNYFKSIERIAINALNKNDIPFEKILKFLESFSYLEKSENAIDNINGVVLIYQSLLKFATMSNDVKKVTSITYSLHTIKNSLEVSGSKETEVYKLFMLSSLSKNPNMAHETEDFILFTLFQGLLKSIELGNYGVTGQLIKRITTDFKGGHINNIFKIFYESRGNLNNAYPRIIDTKIDNNPFNDLITDYAFNQSSFDYCAQKLVFLLLGQECLIILDHISFTEFYRNSHSFIEFDYFKPEYLDYIAQKIINVGDDYGLIFIKKDNFVTDLAKYIKQNLTT